MAHPFPAKSILPALIISDASLIGSRGEPVHFVFGERLRCLLQVSMSPTLAASAREVSKGLHTFEACFVIVQTSSITFSAKSVSEIVVLRRQRIYLASFSVSNFSN